MLHKQAVSLNCVHYYYITISIAHFTHDYHFSVLIEPITAKFSGNIFKSNDELYNISNADFSPLQTINSIQSCNYTISMLSSIYMYLFLA